jgi:hypothetical protein
LCRIIVIINNGGESNNNNQHTITPAARINAESLRLLLNAPVPLQRRRAVSSCPTLNLL